jgi:UDP-N-acetylmuramoyl-L-alanyl-D-glutamate--2,6-diaminopimelate ligase
MKRIRELLHELPVSSLVGTDERMIGSLHLDSHDVVPGGLFFALKGTVSDGHHFIDQAVLNGACAVVCEKAPEKIREDVTYVLVPCSREAAGIIASAFHDHPSHKLTLIGVTGTNGKTTVATLLYELFEILGHPSGLISTIRNIVHSRGSETTHTTPDPIKLNSLLQEMVTSGCRYAFMEVSSHAIVQNRIGGLKFSGGIFTNLTHEHLDYHQTFEEYLKSKKRFFDSLPADAFALVNKDDRNGMVMVQNTKASIYSYTLRAMGDFRGKILENNFQGLHLSIDGNDVWFRLTGRFNAYNLIAVYGMACLLEQERQSILEGLSTIGPVDGRFNFFTAAHGVTAIVDYAHTPDALQNVLETINEIRERKGLLYTVVGAGGNRDRAKRPEMARISCQFSDRVILTSDNPRFEDPGEILDEMKKGIPTESGAHVMIIHDRKEAIKVSCAMAGPGDIILVAGKGHETYQEIKGVRYPFNDIDILREYLGRKTDN